MPETRPPHSGGDDTVAGSAEFPTEPSNLQVVSISGHASGHVPNGDWVWSTPRSQWTHLRTGVNYPNKTIHVGPSGNDANDGSSITQRKRTIAAAVALLQDGYTLEFEPNGAFTGESIQLGTLNNIEINTNGSTFDGNGSTVFRILGGTGTIINGFVAANVGGTGMLFQGGVHTVNDLTANGSTDQFVQVTSGAKLVVNNVDGQGAADEFFSIHTNSPKTELIVNGGRLHNNGTAAIHSLAGTIVRTRGLVIEDNGSSTGHYQIQAGDEWYGDRMTIRGAQSNPFVVASGMLTNAVVDLAGASLNLRAQHNGTGAFVTQHCTWAGHQRLWIDLSATSSNTWTSTNDVFLACVLVGNPGDENMAIDSALIAACPSVQPTPTNSQVVGTVAEALVNDYANQDYRLRAGSPAIDIGADLGIGTDIVGDVRNQGSAPNAGAFETVVA